MSDVSTATLRADGDVVRCCWLTIMAGAKATDVPTKDVKMASFMVGCCLLLCNAISIEYRSNYDKCSWIFADGMNGCKADDVEKRDA